MKATVRREIKEELGFNLEAKERIAVYSGAKWVTEYPSGDKTQQLLMFFEMSGGINVIQLQQSEISDYRFVLPDDVPEDLMACCKQKVIDDYAYNGQAIFR